MLWSIENLWMSDTIELSRLIEFLGSISMADVSSRNSTLRGQSAKRLFVIIMKSITPSLTPWGRPPLRNFQSDSVAAVLTACCLSVRNAAIQLMSMGSTSSFHSSVIKMTELSCNILFPSTEEGDKERVYCVMNQSMVAEKTKVKVL